MAETARVPQRPLRVRAFAEVAASVIAPYYGLDAAIAINPVLPALSDGFASALAHAAPELGGRGALSESQYRAHLTSGRIPASDLAAAIRARESSARLTRDEAPDELVVRRFLDESGGVESGGDERRADVSTSSRSRSRSVSRIDEYVARWCRVALAPDAASWPVPVATRGFYGAWRALALHDPLMPRAVRRRVRTLPETSDAALSHLVDALDVVEADLLDVLRDELARLPGWTAYIRWRSMTTADVDVVDYLAVRLALRWALGQADSVGGHRDPRQGEQRERAAARSLVWQQAFEAAPHHEILNAITQRASDPSPAVIAPQAHLVFCIDPRSEGIRRHLEGQGPYATFGFAGFFGIAAMIEPLAAASASAACPVLLTPRYSIAERPAPATWRAAAAFVTRQSLRRAWRSSLKAPDALAGAPLGWAEITGWIMGPHSIARSVLAGRSSRRGRPDDPASPASTLYDIDTGLSLETQIDTAEVILRTMGMVENFAPFVVFVGHGTSTTNNAFRSALDCGACGGHRGAPNARIAASLLNRRAIRAALGERGIEIPHDTLFVAAEHDTATDEVIFADQSEVPAARRADAERIAHHIDAAGRLLATERAAELPGAAARTAGSVEVGRRSRDWAQVYPEWGLARNAAIIIGPRSLTAGIDLQRRTFLHSYAPQHDPEGAALETILTAPLVVAHWINAQYYFSSVDPEVFGAGSKTVHNLVGGTGVVTGPSGDLRLGLPWQSVGTRSGLHHEPVRLLAVVDAPRERIMAIVERSDVVKDLVHGEWVILVRPGDEPGTWERCIADGWQPWHITDNEHTVGREAA